MRAIDFSRSLNYLGDDIIAEAMASGNAKAARKKLQLARCVAAAASCAAVILIAVLAGLSGNRDMPVRPPVSNDVTVLPPYTQSTAPITTAEPPITSVSDTSGSDASTETSTSDEAPPIGGGDYTFERKYVEEVENIYIASQIVGQDARNEWVDNVYLKLSAEEQSELPALYRIIHDLNIAKEDFIAENEKYSDYPGMYYSVEIIDALYLDDIAEMKRRLVNPMALYYDGEIYTYSALLQTPELAENIPCEVLSEYLDYIYNVAVQIGEIKYMQDDINKLREYAD